MLRIEKVGTSFNNHFIDCLSDVTLTWGEMGQLGDWGWLSVTREKGGGGGTEYKWLYSLHALYPASPVTRPGLGLLDPGQLVAPPGSGAGLGAKIKYFAATKLAELIQNNGRIHCKGFWTVFWSELEICAILARGIMRHWTETITAQGARRNCPQ